MAFNCMVEAMWNFIALIRNKDDTLRLLHDQGYKICGSNGDWILMTNHPTYDRTLYNLCAKAIVNIPPIPYSMPNMNHVIHKVVLSSCFNVGSCFQKAMVIYGEEKELAFYDFGTKRWSLLQKSGTGYDDVICHEGGFYAVDEYGKVVVYRFDNGCHVRQLVNPWCFSGQKVYLVVMEEALFLIIRHVRSDCSGSCSRTNLFNVYVLLNGYNFREVSNLEECAIVLSQNQAVALVARKSQGLRESCIYFRDDCNHSNEGEMRAFSMEEQWIQVMEGDDADKLNRLWQELYLSS